MTRMRKTHPLQTKVKVALEAIKGEKTTSEITSKYGIHTTQINKHWNKFPMPFLEKERSKKKTSKNW